MNGRTRPNLVKTTIRPQDTPQQVTLGVYADLMPTESRRFGEQTSMFRDLARMGRDRKVDVVVLTPGFARSHRGWRLEGDDWVQAEMPMPHIVLRRSGTFRQAALKDVEMDLKQFRAAKVLHTLPRICGNKWAVLSLFRGCAQLRPHVPETLVAGSAAEVLHGLNRIGDVYVKPLAGAQGISIYRLSRTSPGIRVRYERRKVSRLTERLTDQFDPATSLLEETFSTPDQFTAFWRTLRMGKCLVQETIALPSLSDGRPFDFRWLVQYIDRPTIVARVARVGRPFAVTTNIHTGGTAMPAEEAIRLAKLGKPKTLVRTLDTVALAVAECLTRRHGRYAEVGIDLACKPDGSVVIFEVNPTPGRRMLRSLGEDVRKLSLECLLEYASRANQ